MGLIICVLSFVPDMIYMSNNSVKNSWKVYNNIRWLAIALYACDTFRPLRTNDVTEVI